MYVSGSAEVVVDNCMAEAEDHGFQASGRGAYIGLHLAPNSAWDCNRGAYATGFCSVNITRLAMINCTSGAYATRQTLVIANEAAAAACTTGYYAEKGGYIDAPDSDAENQGNGTDYNPAPGGIPGSAQGNHYGTIYAS